MDEEVDHKEILIVDDEETVRRTLERIVQRVGRECVLVDCAEAGRKALQSQAFDLVFSDIQMPGESGLDFIRHVIREYPHTAVIMVTGVDDPETVETALEMGAYGYIVKPFKVSEVVINISSALRRRQLEAQSRAYQADLEQKVADRTAELEKTLDGLIEAIARTIESRDPYTAGHQRRVSALACAIATEMGLPENQIKGIRMAALIHDLGKLSIPSEILSKPGQLSDMEFALIQNHVEAGYEILKGITFPWPVAEITRQHHERMNGSGYPRGLTSQQILLEAKVMAVADVVEAMTSHRPYRPALGLDAALQEITDKKGMLYDPDPVDACVALFQDKKFEWD